MSATCDGVDWYEEEASYGPCSSPAVMTIAYSVWAYGGIERRRADVCVMHQTPCDAAFDIDVMR